MIRAGAACLVALILSCAPVAAQDWSFISPLTAQALDVQAGDQAPLLFSDHPDPSTANHALIFHYFESRTGGNSFGLNVGLFRRDGGNWHFVGPVQIYGVSPRDAAFLPGSVEVVTTMPGPNDPRCCPTRPTTWSVNTTTLAVTRYN